MRIDKCIHQTRKKNNKPQTQNRVSHWTSCSISRHPVWAGCCHQAPNLTVDQTIQTQAAGPIVSDTKTTTVAHLCSSEWGDPTSAAPSSCCAWDSFKVRAGNAYHLKPFASPRCLTSPETKAAECSPGLPFTSVHCRLSGAQQTETSSRRVRRHRGPLVSSWRPRSGWLC